MPDERRRNTDGPVWQDTATILAILYTLGYFAMVLLLMTRGIPEANKDAINQLLGAMTIIQTGIVAYYFGGSKNVDNAQRTGMASLATSNAVIAEIAKATPTPIGGPPPVTPGPTTPDGVVPAAEVVKP